jgi:hypothetical protein
VKDTRNPNRWSNQQIQADTEGNLAERLLRREDRAACAAPRREVDNLRRFTEAFVKAGGKRQDAEQAFWEQRNTEALQSARTADDQARAEQRRRVRQGL